MVAGNCPVSFLALGDYSDWRISMYVVQTRSISLAASGWCESYARYWPVCFGFL